MSTQHQGIHSDHASWHGDTSDVDIGVHGPALEGDATFERQHVGDVDAGVANGGREHVLAHVEQHRMRWVASVDEHSLGRTAIGEIHNRAIEVALVELEQHILKRKLELVWQTHHGDLLACGAHRGELGALGYQDGLGVAQVRRLRGQDGHPEVQVINNDPDGVLVDLVREVSDAVDHDVMVDHVAVAVAVLDVGATDTNESLDVVGTKLDGVGIHPVDGAEQTVVNRDLARAAFAERKVALHIDELRQHEGGVLDAGLNERATSKVQINRLAARWHSQTFRTKAADEINRWLGLGRALPAVAPVHSDLDVLTIQLEDVATTGDHELARRSLE